MNNDELLYNKLYEKTRDCGRAQFVKLLTDKERENNSLKELVEYLRRSIDRKESTIIDLQMDRDDYIESLENTIRKLLTYLNKNKLVLNNPNILEFYTNINEILNNR